MFNTTAHTQIDQNDLMQVVQQEIEEVIFDSVEITNSGAALVVEARGYERIDVPWTVLNRLSRALGTEAAIEYILDTFFAPFMIGVVRH